MGEVAFVVQSIIYFTMNSNNYSSSNSIIKVEPSTIVSQISATILYKLLQNASQEQSNVLSSAPKMELKPNSNDSHERSTVLSVGKEGGGVSQTDQTSVSIDVDLCNYQKHSSNVDTCFTVKYSNIPSTESVKMNPKKRFLQRHLLEKSCEENKSDTGSEVTSRHSASNDAPFGRGKNGKPLTRTPFIPSYMDPKSGPFLCKVCGYKASGLHYRVMACEGCKGFFRRSVQKKLKYVCKMNNNCQINSDNRTKCQECRWNLCLESGMDVASVLNEDERRTKNDLIKANRQKRKQSAPAGYIDSGTSNTSSVDPVDLREKQLDLHAKTITETIEVVTKAFEIAFIKDQDSETTVRGFQRGQEFTNRVTMFVKLLPGINELSQVTQSTLLQNRCLDLICLCTVLTYNPEHKRLKLPNGRFIDATFVEKNKHLEPLWHFAKRIAEYGLSKSEVAVLAGLALLVNNTIESMEPLYNNLLAALDYLMAGQALRNSKLLIVIFSDLQVLTSRLFELRAPLGHQLLFDTESPYVKDEPKGPVAQPQIILRPNQVLGSNKASESNCTTKIISLPTSGGSSIFAFSYGDRQL